MVMELKILTSKEIDIIRDEFFNSEEFNEEIERIVTTFDKLYADMPAEVFAEYIEDSENLIADFYMFWAGWSECIEQLSNELDAHDASVSVINKVKAKDGVH